MPAKGRTKMLQASAQLGTSTSISVIGAGIAGTWQALLFAKVGREVTIYERDERTMTGGTSHWAGGMLAPACRRRTLRAGDHAAGPALARSVARGAARDAVQRLAGGRAWPR